MNRTHHLHPEDEILVHTARFRGDLQYLGYDEEHKVYGFWWYQPLPYGEPIARFIAMKADGKCRKVVKSLLRLCICGGQQPSDGSVILQVYSYGYIHEEDKKGIEEAAAKYRNGDITIGRLAEILGISLIEARERFGAPLGFGDDDEEANP
jgi:hypothetical protein